MSIPGVPNLLQNTPKAIGITLLGNLASTLWNLLFPGPTWGVFNVGTSDPAIEVSSVIEQDIAAEARVSDYIIQTGSFTSYNKVRQPDIITIRMTKDGAENSRLDLLEWLDANVTATSLFDILSPERRYPNVTLIGYRLGRSARSGAAMVVADCLFQQVREKPVTFAKTSDPTSVSSPNVDGTNIASPENKPMTPVGRVYTLSDASPNVTEEVLWQ